LPAESRVIFGFLAGNIGNIGNIGIQPKVYPLGFDIHLGGILGFLILGHIQEFWVSRAGWLRLFSRKECESRSYTVILSFKEIVSKTFPMNIDVIEWERTWDLKSAGCFTRTGWFDRHGLLQV